MGSNHGCAGTAKRIHHHVAGTTRIPDRPFNQLYRLPRRVQIVLRQFGGATRQGGFHTDLRRDRFGECGPAGKVFEYLGVTAAKVAAAVEGVLA